MKILIFFLIIGLFLSSIFATPSNFVFAQNNYPNNYPAVAIPETGIPLPETPEEIEAVAKRALDLLPGFLNIIWQQVLEYLQLIWRWIVSIWRSHLWPFIRNIWRNF